MFNSLQYVNVIPDGNSLHFDKSVQLFDNWVCDMGQLTIWDYNLDGKDDIHCDQSAQPIGFSNFFGSKGKIHVKLLDGTDDLQGGGAPRPADIVYLFEAHVLEAVCG